MTDDDLLRMITVLEPHAYFNAIFTALDDRPPRWFGRHFPTLHMIFGGPSIGGLYARLDRLEARGLIRSELSKETFPERGDKPRRYYFVNPV